MSTIIIDSNIYNSADAFARSHNASVQKMVEAFLSKVGARQKSRQRLAELPPEFARWEGALAGVENKRKDDERLDCLLSKY